MIQHQQVQLILPTKVSLHPVPLEAEPTFTSSSWDDVPGPSHDSSQDLDILFASQAVEWQIIWFTWNRGAVMPTMCLLGMVSMMSLRTPFFQGPRPEPEPHKDASSGTRESLAFSRGALQTEYLSSFTTVPCTDHTELNRSGTTPKRWCIDNRFATFRSLGVTPIFKRAISEWKGHCWSNSWNSGYSLSRKGCCGSPGN